MTRGARALIRRPRLLMYVRPYFNGKKNLTTTTACAYYRYRRRARDALKTVKRFFSFAYNGCLSCRGFPPPLYYYYYCTRHFGCVYTTIYVLLSCLVTRITHVRLRLAPTALAVP